MAGRHKTKAHVPVERGGRGSSALAVVAERGEPRWQEWRVTFVLRTDLRVPDDKQPNTDVIEEFVTRAIDDANAEYSGEGDVDAHSIAVVKLGTVAS